jgi:hypothetical protein
MQAIDCGAGKSVTPQADQVQSRQRCAIAEGKTKRDEIVFKTGEPAKKGMRANSHELLHGRAAAESRVISHDDVSCQHDVVGEKHVVAEPAIMRDMRLREQSAAIADIRRHTTVRRSGIEGHAFANDAIGTDLKRRGFAGIFFILRRVSDGGERKYPGPRTDRRAARDDNMGDEFDPFAQHDVTPDIAKRADPHTAVELRPALHERQRMDESGGPLRLHIGRGASQGAILPAASEAPISASQTSTPSTFAFPSNHHMLRF